MEWHWTQCRVVIYAFLPGASKLCALSSSDAVYNKAEQKNIVFIFKSRQGEV
jgi:hypothetical protein